MQKIILFIALLLPFISHSGYSQTGMPVYFKGAAKEKRTSLYRNIVQHTITDNLSRSLDDDTEENWTDAFGAMELLHYRSPWANGRINFAFDALEKRSIAFQRALLELAFSNYSGQYTRQVISLLNNSGDAKIVAMSAEYLLLSNKQALVNFNLQNKKKQLAKNKQDEAILKQLFDRIENCQKQPKPISITPVMNAEFLKGHIILYSFQRKNRNYPGLALIRDSTGNLVKDEKGALFAVPQLARSISNLPGYLTNGNTPQGIFRMYGFDTSKSNFIGPTTNIQLTMPFETSLQHFFHDSTITDTVWAEDWYKKLLPPGLKNYRPFYESFYAGMAGRTEIIAHGTTVDPEYYAGETYYPQTPTMGCLCTKEIWSEVDGLRLESDQQQLAAALQAAGGADGYCVVIEIDDAQQPVEINEILSLLNPTSKP